MHSILFLFPYKNDGGRPAAFSGSCVQDFIMFSPAEMLILSVRNKCFFFEPSVVSAALNRKAESGYVLTANLTYFTILSIFSCCIYLYICN